MNVVFTTMRFYISTQILLIKCCKQHMGETTKGQNKRIDWLEQKKSLFS